MIVLGLLLVLFAGCATVMALIAPSSTVQVISLTNPNVTVSASPLAVFLTGAASVVLFGLGFALISRGTRRKARARKELRELRKDQAATEKTADAETSYSRRHGAADGTETATTKGDSTAPNTANGDSTAPNTTKTGNQNSGPQSQPERSPGSQPSH